MFIIDYVTTNWAEISGAFAAGFAFAVALALHQRHVDFGEQFHAGHLVALRRQREGGRAAFVGEAVEKAGAGEEGRRVEARLLGVGAAHLEQSEQMALFGALDERRRSATRAADAIRSRYGTRAIVRARLLGSGVAEPFERDPMTAPEARRVGRARPGATGSADP